MRSIPFPSLPVILVLAFGLRVLWSFVIPVEPVSDAAAYDVFARNIAQHGVYGWTPDEPGAYWAVGPSALYAGAYLVFGFNGFAVIAVNMISSMVAVWGIYDLGRRWFDTRTGCAAALLFAVWPVTIQYVTVLASELHFIALTILGLALWARAGLRDARGWGMLVLAGLVFAGATYMRPIALLIPAALAVAAFLRAPRHCVPQILRAAVVTAIIFAAVSPWSARNERVFGEPVFMSTNFWANFWMGNSPGTDGGYRVLPAEVEGMSEIARSDHMKALSVDYLKEAPGAFVWRTIWKAVRLHERETIGVAWNEAAIERLAGTGGVFAAKLVSSGYWYAMLLAALAGIVILIRQRNAWQALLLSPVWLWLYFTAIHAVIVVEDRYHLPAIPMIALLAAVALSRLGAPPPGRETAAGA